MSSTPEIDTVRFSHTPSAGEATEHFFVVCNRGMAQKWREHPNTPLVDVLQIFDIYQGTTHKADRPSHEELQKVFGTDKLDDIILRILKEGQIVHTKGIWSRSFHN